MVSVRCYKTESATGLILVPLISISGVDAKGLELKGFTVQLARSEREAAWRKKSCAFSCKNVKNKWEHKRVWETNKLKPKYPAVYKRK